MFLVEDRLSILIRLICRIFPVHTYHAVQDSSIVVYITFSDTVNNT